MDTRKKILTAGQACALRLPSLAVATGYFDVLVPGHIRDLEGARRRSGALLVLVLPMPGEILCGRARAELVAGLRMVDYVVISDCADPQGLIDELRPSELARLEAADLCRARELREHVHGRHQH